MESRGSFFTLLQKRWKDARTLVCVGLDSEYSRIPEILKPSISSPNAVSTSLFNFNKEIIDATSDLVCCYKLQMAFYAAEGEGGLNALHQTIHYIHNKYDDIPIILDGKRSDIGSTSEQYAIELFDIFKADGATFSPFFGRESCEPFLGRKNKGLFFLCHTSNPGAAEFQELFVLPNYNANKESVTDKPIPLYQLIAMNIANEWNENGNCGLVVGATFPDQLAVVRDIVGDMPLLLPGIGTQHGDVQSTVKAGKDSHGYGMLISSSRAIIFASDQPDFAQASYEATSNLRTLINSYL